MKMLQQLKSRLGRFGREESGTIMAETIIVLPMLLWAYLALFVYWDSFRTMNTVQKASYTISDMISREMVAVNDAYVMGMRSVMNSMLDAGESAQIRVTSVRWSQANNRFEVHWSRSTDLAQAALTTSSLQTFASKIPAMADGDYVILVETRVPYTPAFEVGLDNTVLTQFIITRPRFVPKVCHTSFTC